MAFTIQNILTAACRDRCMAKLKILIPTPTGRSQQSPAAMMVPLCRVKQTPSLLFTMSPNNVIMNMGEVSFPGGRSEANETPFETVLRRLRMDLGILPKKIHFWGQGTPIASANNEFLITPVIGVIDDLKPSDVNINTNEVSGVFSVPIHYFCNPNNQYYTQFSNGYILPVFIADNYKIWGITSYLTHVFLSCTLSNEVYQTDWFKNQMYVHS